MTASNEEVWQAVGLATTAVPNMEMDADHPVEMMQQVVDRVDALKDSRDKALTRIGHVAQERDRIRTCLKSTKQALTTIGKDCDRLRGQLETVNTALGEATRRLQAMTDSRDQALERIRLLTETRPEPSPPYPKPRSGPWTGESERSSHP